MPAASRALVRGIAGSMESATPDSRSVSLGQGQKLKVLWPAADQASGPHSGEVEQLLWWRIRPGSLVLEGRFVVASAAGPVRELVLAVDVSGANAPSRVAAGLDMPGASDPTVMASIRWFAGMSLVGLGIGAIIWLVAKQVDSRLRPA